MDDTRDIAIRAEASSSSAHKRLDTINGQIGRLGNSHEKMREDINRALYGEGDGNDGLVHAVVELRGTVAHALKVAAVIATAVLAVCTGLTVYAVEHLHSAAPAAPQGTSGSAAASAPPATTASRQRGSSGR